MWWSSFRLSAKSFGIEFLIRIKYYGAKTAPSQSSNAYISGPLVLNKHRYFENTFILPARLNLVVLTETTTGLELLFALFFMIYSSQLHSRFVTVSIFITVMYEELICNVFYSCYSFRTACPVFLRLLLLPKSLNLVLLYLILFFMNPFKLGRIF